MDDDERECLEWDIERLTSFLVSIGLDREDVGDLVLDGSNEERDEAREIIKRRMNVSRIYKWYCSIKNMERVT